MAEERLVCKTQSCFWKSLWSICSIQAHRPGNWDSETDRGVEWRNSKAGHRIECWVPRLVARHRGQIEEMTGGDNILSQKRLSHTKERKGGYSMWGYDLQSWWKSQDKNIYYFELFFQMGIMFLTRDACALSLPCVSCAVLCTTLSSLSPPTAALCKAS